LFTVREADPLTVPELAVIVVAPVTTPVASPLVLIVAMLGLEELQVAVLVRSWVLPSVKLPVAVN
jgi:hypothetical protein